MFGFFGDEFTESARCIGAERRVARTMALSSIISVGGGL